MLDGISKLFAQRSTILKKRVYSNGKFFRIKSPNDEVLGLNKVIYVLQYVVE
jgi:hypothetical protein